MKLNNWQFGVIHISASIYGEKKKREKKKTKRVYEETIRLYHMVVSGEKRERERELNLAQLRGSKLYSSCLVELESIF